jgi:DNA helicase-2/ATP-dependent DNA helicase PcrA
MLQLDILLNDEQKKAVEYLDGPLLVLAGAGTGKTRVITFKIAYLIEYCNVPASNILAVTFTNKAAKEMQDRLKEIIGNKALPIWVGTFHSIALRILRNDGHLLGLKASFSIIDEEDRLSIVNRILKELNIDKKQFPAKEYVHLISKFKNSIDYVNEKMPSDEIYRFVDVFNSYKKHCHLNNSIDFDDMLSFTLRLLIKEHSVLEYYKQLFKYILVDEYQDTNLLQFNFIKYLSSGKNICVVGDDDQSIYSWRGADIKNILEFDKHFTDTVVVKLTTNYRSCQKILDIANTLISHNKYRRGKDLKTVKNFSGNVEIVNLENDEAEAQFVIRKITEVIDSGVKPAEVAVLYRTNAQSRIFETYLANSNIPYKVIGNISFYQRKEVKDILSYLKFFDNPYDSQSLVRAIKNPPIGIGDATVNKIIDYAREKKMDFISAMNSMLNMVTRKQSEALKDFLNIFEKLEGMTDISAMINLIIKERKYEEYLKQFEEDYVANKRIYNIYELISAATQFTENNKDAHLTDFLASTSLITSTDEINNDAVNLITVHSAKGLEFDTLFLVGLEEGLFPLYRAYSSYRDLEEERRLCYVAITRAKHKLYITWAKRRMVYGNIVDNNPSPFLQELMKNKLLNNIVEETNSFKRGDYVEHDKFGKGVIIDLSGSGEDSKAKIIFKHYGTKTIIAKFLRRV